MNTRDDVLKIYQVDEMKQNLIEGFAYCFHKLHNYNIKNVFLYQLVY